MFKSLRGIDIPDALKAAGLTWLWLGLFHLDLFFSPNEMLLASGRDAVKNIYTLAWQLAHGPHASFEFAGMGWPFTEHIFYTDGHPLVSWLIGWMVPNGLPAEWIVGGVHLAILASWGLASAVLMKILNRFGVQGTWAVLACSLLPLMHPQWLRWTGHYALSYGVALPLTWWLQLRWMDRPNWKRAMVQTLNLCFWLLTHAYLGAISTAFAGLMGGFFLLKNPRKLLDSQTVRQGVQWLVISAVPLMAYMSLLSWSDSHPFRTDRPYGFWDNVATWNAAILPSHGPLGALRRELGWGLTPWEGWGHIGIAATAALIFILLQTARNLMLRKKVGQFEFSKPVWIAIFAVVVLYAVAVGEPFLTGSRDWLEDLKLFSQFRAIGRFTWPAIWVLPVAATLWAQKQSSWMRWLFLALLAGDAFWMQQEARRQMDPQPNAFQAATPLINDVIEWAKTGEIAAIHPVPWFQMGSESVGREGTETAHLQALAASFHSGLPVTATHLTRMSISESRLLSEWMGHPGLEKPLLQKIPSSDRSRNLLLLQCDEMDTWAADDQALWNRGYPTANPKIKTLRVDEWLEIQEAKIEQVAPRSNAADWQWNGLNSIFFPEALEGGRAARGLSYEYLIIDTIRPDSAWLHHTVEASCWFWHDSEHAGRDALQFEWVVEAEWPGGKREWIEHVPVASSGDHYQGWTRASNLVQLDSLPQRLNFFSIGFGTNKDSIWADAFRIRPL